MAGAAEVFVYWVWMGFALAVTAVWAVRGVLLTLVMRRRDLLTEAG